jgi:hypothetical protein
VDHPQEQPAGMIELNKSLCSSILILSLSLSLSSTIQQICKDLALNGFQTAEVEDVWTRHPNRQQQLQG